MTKLMFVPAKKQIDELLIHSNVFLIGLEGFSTNFLIYYSLEEIESLSRKNIELFVSINKNIHSTELIKLKDILLKLDKLNIKGIFYYDTSLVELKKELNLKLDLVWNAEHLITNYETINFWNKQGVKYACLSSDITIPEMIEIKKNTKSILIAPIFGHQSMFVSERRLIDNYVNTYNLEDATNINYIEHEGKKYPILNSYLTNVYTDKPLYGINEYIELKNAKMDYLLFNEAFIKRDDFIKIIKSYIEEKPINIGDTYLLHKRTIYKVKQ